MGDSKKPLTDAITETGAASPVLKREISDDSLMSVIFPWRGRACDRNKRTVPANEATATTTTTIGFYLYIMAVLLLLTGVGLSVVTLWTLLYRIPYVHLTAGSFFMGANSFVLCSGIVSIPCCWIAWICHDNKKNYLFLPLLLVFLGFSMSMLVTGVGIGFAHRSKMNFDRSKNPPRLIHGLYKSTLNDSMVTAMESYDLNLYYRASWDKVQQRLGCCGIDGPHDWLQYSSKVPASCFLNHQCSDPKIVFLRGCLDLLSYDLAWEICLLTGLSCISLCVQIITLLLASFVYVSDRLSLI